MCTGRGSNQGPLGPKSDPLISAPLKGTKVYINDPGHMIKMDTAPIYDKHFKSQVAMPGKWGKGVLFNVGGKIFY